MAQYADPALLRDVTTILLDCGLRPEECFRLQPENVTGSTLEIHYGKTDNARRRISMTVRVNATLDMRLSKANGGPRSKMPSLYSSNSILFAIPVSHVRHPTLDPGRWHTLPGTAT
jgi:hypothetical protein